MTDLTACREAFEIYGRSKGWQLSLCPEFPGEYDWAGVQNHWECWQAAWNTRADQGGAAVAVGLDQTSDGAWISVRQGERVVYSQFHGLSHPPRAAAGEDAMRELAATFRRVAPTVIASQETVYLYAAAQIEKTLSAQRGE